MRRRLSYGLAEYMKENIISYIRNLLFVSGTNISSANKSIQLSACSNEVGNLKSTQ